MPAHATIVQASVRPGVQSADARNASQVKLFRQLERPSDADSIRSLQFDGPEFQRRLQAVRAAIQAEGLDAFVCTFAPSVCYVSGYETLASFAPAFLIVRSEHEPTLLVDHFEAFNVLVSSWVEDVVTFPWGADPTDVLIDLLRHRGLESSGIGWEHHQHGAAYESFVRVSEATGDQWKYLHGMVDRVRARKSEAEIAAIRAAGLITPRGYDAVADRLMPGVPDTAVAGPVYEALIGGGSERMSIQPIITAARNSGIPHTTFGRSRLTAGYPVILEWGACIKRYTAPMIRTGVIGELEDPLWNSMYDACLGAVERTIEGMRPGVSTLELAQQASESLNDLPTRVFRDGNRGYSVGLSFEPDWADVPGLQIATREYRSEVSLATYGMLEPGHVFHVRAVARDVGRAGVGVSETVVVTMDGCEVLTSYDQSMISVR